MNLADIFCNLNLFLHLQNYVALCITMLPSAFLCFSCQMTHAQCQLSFNKKNNLPTPWKVILNDSDDNIFTFKNSEASLLLYKPTSFSCFVAIIIFLLSCFFCFVSPTFHLASNYNSGCLLLLAWSLVYIGLSLCFVSLCPFFLIALLSSCASFLLNLLSSFSRS